MQMGSQLKIGQQSFSDAHEARQFVRHLLARYPINSLVDNNEDREFLIALILRHPDLQGQGNSNVTQLKVVRNRAQKATELKVTVGTGQEIQIAWAECLI